MHILRHLLYDHSRFGRLPASMLCNLLVAGSGIICAFAPNYVIFGIGIVFAGYGRIAVWAIGTVLCTISLFHHCISTDAMYMSFKLYISIAK